MTRKRTKQLIAILLAVTMITLATAKPYQEAKATGGLVAGGFAGAMSNPAGILILMGIIGFASLAVNLNDIEEAGRRDKINKTAKQMKEDFVKYSTQALNNNVSAAEQQRDNAAHARAVIEDFMESASAGVIDTTSEAWDWFKDFVSDIRNALDGGSNGLIMGHDLSGRYENVIVQREDGVVNGTYGVEIKGLDLTEITQNKCFLGIQKYSTNAYVRVYEILNDGTVSVVKGLGKCGAKFRNIIGYGDGASAETDWSNVSGDFIYSCRIWSSCDYEWGLPVIDATYAAPSGTTDVPGVSNVNDYVAVGSDLPYTRPEGAWDICDPNGKQGQVSIGNDIPGKMGYDDWYDLLGAVNTGKATWEEVANASDVIRIGSDTDSAYSGDNADAWSAYYDGTIIGYDVDAEGNVVITLEGGRTIAIPQDQVAGIEFVNERDKAQELDKDTAFPVSGTLVIPLDPVIEQDTPANPDDPGGGGGDMKVDPDVSDYTLDFRKLFPFCIPFDIYKAVKLLDATPTAPVVHYKFYLSKSKSYNIDLNLNKFNSVAAILRRMECLLFIIGLATATRRIYIRG